MLHVNPAGDNTDDIEALAKEVGVLRYTGPINSCPLCGTPTSGVLCTPCATK